MQRVQAFWQALFAVFAFLYLYVLQGDLLSIGLAELFPPFIAVPSWITALAITVLASLLTFLLGNIVRYSGSLYAMRFIPAAILVVMLSQYPVLRPSVFTGILCALLFIIWCIVGRKTKARHRVLFPTPATPTDITKQIWGILLIFLFIGIGGESNDTTHYELRAVKLLREGRYEEVGEVGKKSLATTRQLTALRCYALSQTSAGLGDKLFSLPFPERENNFSKYENKFATPENKFYSQEIYNLTDTIKSHIEKGDSTLARDYRLCSLLLDKQIDAFANELPRYYNLNRDTLPRHYAEAAMLYCRLRTSPIFVYNNANISANFRDFLEMEKKHPTPASRKNVLRRSYGDTYWWYYFYF